MLGVSGNKKLFISPNPLLYLKYVAIKYILFSEWTEAVLFSGVLTGVLLSCCFHLPRNSWDKKQIFSRNQKGISQA